MISIVIPTVEGREEHLARCTQAYRERTRSDYELLIMPGFDCCGKAWNAGAELAAGDYLHFTADDLEPREGWDQAALQATSWQAMRLPAPVVFKPDGSVETAGGWWAQIGEWPANMAVAHGTTTTNTCVVPFFPRVLWPEIGPIIEAHYYTDNHFTARAKALGWEFVVRHDYAFTHHWAREGRDDGPEKMQHDKAIYEAAT